MSLNIEPVFKRHGDHHNINLKYGYFLFVIILIHISILSFNKYYRTKKISQSLKSTKVENLIIKLTNPPTFVVIGAYTVIVGLLTAHHLTKSNYVYSVKRLGRLAYILSNIDIFLILRPNNLLFPNYIPYVATHKWISRIILLCGSIHSFGFIFKWIIVDHKFWKILSPLNFLGAIVFTSFVILFVSSLRFIRRRSYTWFIYVHHATVILFIVLIQFHARPGVSYFFLINLFLLSYNLYTKLELFKQNLPLTNESTTVDRFPGTNLKVVTVNKDHLVNMSELYNNFTPGASVRIATMNSFVDKIIRLGHPYTIASESHENVLKFIIKDYGSVQTGPGSNILGIHESLLPPWVFTPVSPAMNNTGKDVIVVVGGSGISFGLPIFNFYSQQFARDGHNGKVKLIWCIKYQHDAQILQKFRLINEIDVFVTKGSSSAPASGHKDENVNDPLLFDGDIELKEFKPSSNEGIIIADDDDEDDLNANGFNFRENQNSGGSNSPPTPSDEGAGNLVNFHDGRPDLLNLISQWDVSATLNETGNKGILFSCGPHSMNKDCQHIGKKLGFDFFSELYEM